MISVVIPLYNKERYVGRAVESVLRQTYPQFELIVVDDGSTDLSRRVVETYKDSRIRIISQSNSGVSAARNTGIRYAAGELIAFLDADDEWTPGFLEHVLSMYNQYPHAGLFATAYQIRTGDRSYLPRIVQNPENFREGGPIRYFYVAARAEAGPVCSSAVCIRTGICREVGGFLRGQVLGEDLDLWGRIALRHPIIWSSYVGAFYWQDDSLSAIKTITPQEELPFVRTARRELAVNMALGDETRQELREYITFLQILLARQCISCGNRRLAIRLLHDADTTSLQWRAKYRGLMLAVAPQWVSKVGQMLKQRLQKALCYPEGI